MKNITMKVSIAVYEILFLAPELIGINMFTHWFSNAVVKTLSDIIAIEAIGLSLIVFILLLRWRAR